jgi:uncharacterized OB-fold protein
MSQPTSESPGAQARPPYLRAIDPIPLEAAEHNKLHAFYDHLAEGRLTTTRCRDCGRIDWPPRGFCPTCASDVFDWTELPREGRVHGFTVQETGVPVGFPRPAIFAMVEVGELRLFAPLTGVAEPARLQVGAPVRLAPQRVADDPSGQPRYLLAFTPSDAAP